MILLLFLAILNAIFSWVCLKLLSLNYRRKEKLTVNRNASVIRV